MRKRLIEKFTKCKEGSLGYTLTELLVVIGIIAIVCAIAIPSVVSISKSLRFAQRNDYAKSIFMAAQANLTEMRADGGLAPLQRAGLDSLPVQEELCGFPVEDWSPEYVYTSSETSQQLTYALVLPVGSVDGTLREQQVIIEYNPLTGNVYSVFYSEEKDQNILQDYRDGKLPRNGEGDEKLRKDMMLGYYDGSGLSSAELEIERTKARITFENGEEGIVTVHIPMPDLYVGHHEEFMKGLEVKLNITGEINGGEIKDIMVKRPGQVGTNCKLAVDGKTVEVTYVLDSLANRMSFANLSAGTRPDPNAVLTQNTGNTSLTAIMDEGEFRILPGENVTLSAEVTFQAANDRPNVAVQNAKLGGVNPMFGYLTENLTGGGYTLTIENGRNLQNLNAIAPSVANQITAVVFTEDIYWNQTVAYYNQNYGTAGVFKSPDDEAPARALPYFVPIHNENLFGTARFIFMDGSEEEESFLQTILGWLIGSDFTRNDRVPTLTDEVDSVKDASGKYVPVPHATIDGGGYGVYYLNINSNLYQVPNAGNAATKGKFYATGENQVIDYYFTGLFGYVNTPISDLRVVNPVIKGHDFDDTTSGNKTNYTNPATGALVGACGFNTYLYNCSSYLDTKADGFNWSYADHGTVHPQGDFTADGDQKWYGVSGAGAVGGLVGYAKSHRTTNGAMSDDSKVLAFNRCFAAVPVSGTMRGNGNKDFGYSNGVGGLIGNSQLTNFYNCYASGNVRVSNTYAQTIDNQGADTLQTVLGLGGNGRLSMGGGGFVGTSHGTRYTNCFSTSNVTRISGNGTMVNAGGFVGMMCYDETKAYGHHSGNTSTTVAQHTVFENCYAAGMCIDGNGNYLESFAGGTGTINVSYGTIASYYSPDYYRLFAPYFVRHGADPQYQTHYIFKDSFYLSQYRGNANVAQDHSKKCANPIGYSDLVNLHLKYGDNTWIQGNIDNLKKVPLDAQVFETLIYTLSDVFEGGFFSGLNKLGEILDLFRKSDQNYQFYFTLYDYLVEEKLRPATPTLEQRLFTRYSAGFPSLPWETPVERNTHYYGESTAGMVFPFPKINGLDYYGTWSAEPLTGGLAYYEAYDTANGRTYGYYFDRADTSSLSGTEETVILHDGYAVFSGTKNDKIRIFDVSGNLLTKDGALTPDQYAITLSSPFSPDNSSYYVTRIPEAIFSNLTPGGEGFYSAIRIEVSNDSGTANYWALFNPNTGISQVNNVQFSGNNIVYRENPSDVMIRSARQLNALSSDKMQNVWNDPDVTFIQQLHINAATYDWNNDGNVLNETIPVPGSIGSETKPFCATYSGSVGYVDQARIEGFNLENAIFGNIGTFTKTTQTTDETTGETTTTTTIIQGKVEDLSILIQGGENVTIGGENAQYAAVLAAVSSGIIDNVDIRITGALKLEANTAAGLLAGYISGTEADRAAVIGCDIQAETLSVNAPNAGAVIGQAEYCDIRQGVDSENLPDDVTLTIDGNLTLTGTDVGAYLGASGDLNGDKTIGEVNVDGLTISLNGITAEAQRLGALAGTLDTGSIKNLSVTLNGSYTATGEASTIAGVAAVAKNALVQSVTVNVNGSLTGDTAAGVFGSAENLTVQTTEVTVSGTITGAQAAAGLAGAIEGGNFSGVNVKLMNAAIIANGTEEVTTEDTTAEDGSVIEGTTTTEPAGRAAGYAVEVRGQVETGLVITPNIYDANGNAVATSARIEGNKEAAGFACEITAQVTGTRVAGKLNINGGKKAAGFAVKIAGSDLTLNTNGVTPALENTTVGYLNNSNNNLTVKGESAALFAVEIGSGVNVRNCYVLGKLTGTDLSGFAVTNGGAIDGCSANVTLSGGNAFVRENTGAISNSYGWYGNGVEKDTAEADVTAAAVEGTVISSYFVDIDVPATNDNKSADIYNANKEHRTDSPLKLTAKELNGETGSRWFAAGTYGAYPYSKLVPATYSYPMLRVHYGNWATPPRYAYGVMYYEKYDDGTWKLQIEDMSDLGTTVEKNNDLTGYYTYDGTNVIVRAAEGIFNNEGVIAEVGYAVFFKDETVGQNNLPVNLVLNGASLGSGFQMPLSQNAKYTVYPLTNPTSSITLTDKAVYEGETDETVTMGGWYAHEFNPTETTTHVIRTEGQLRNVAASGSYSQTHDIILGSDFDRIETFSGVYNGGGLRLQKSGSVNGWMGAVTGRIENVDLVLGDLNASFFGNVSGTIALKDVYLASVAENANLINTLSGTLTVPTIEIQGNLNGAVIGTVSGTGEKSLVVQISDLYNEGTDTVTEYYINGAVIGTVDTGATVNLSLTYGEGKDISGSIVDTVNGSFTLNNNPNFGTVSGSLFDEVSGTVTLSEGMTVGTLSGMVCGNVTNTITANKLVDVTTVNELAITTAENGTATVTGGAVFGNVSGTVTLSGGIRVDTLSGSLVYALNGGTVTTGAVEIGTLNAPLVAAFNGGTLSGTSNQTTVQITGEDGITVPVFTDVLGGTVQNYVVSGDVTLGGEAQGALVNTNNGTLSGLTLRAASISVTAADNTVGGLVGTNGTDGDITNCVVEGATANTTANVTVTGAESKSLTFGGLVGENSGDITGTTKVNANITYIQPIKPADDKKDSATIGGLVGKMSGGSLNGAAVSGSINLTNQATLDYQAALAAAEAAGVEPAADLVKPAAATAEGRSYIIGGAVGEDGGAVYQNNTATVTVDSNWAGATSVANSKDLMDNGPVGMFVGYVSDGTFTTCSSNAENGSFQFLGQILINAGTLGDSGEKTWFSHATNTTAKNEYNIGESDTLSGIATNNGFAEREDTYVYLSFYASLDGCTFLFNNVSYTQKISTTEYFHLGERAEMEGGWRPEQLTAGYSATTDVAYKDLAENSTNSRKETDYFWYVDGNYTKVYVTATKDGDWRNYVLWDADGNELIKLDRVDKDERDETITVNGKEVTLYEYKLDLTAKPIAITNTASTFIFDGDATGMVIPDLNGAGCFSQQDYNSIPKWTVMRNNNGSYTWKTGKYYLYLNRNKNGYVTFTDDEARDIRVTVQGENYSLYRGGNNRYYLTYNNDGFTVDNGSGAVKLWIFQFVDNLYQCVFEYNGLQNMEIGAYDSEGNPLNLDSTATTSTDLPGETGEATQGTEVPETTGSNETATVPPAAEDGNNN